MEDFKQHLVVDDKKLVSDLWEEEDESKRNWNLSIADGLYSVAKFLKIAIKKKARFHKEVFSVSCLSALNEQDLDSDEVVIDSILHQAFLLLDIKEARQQRKLLVDI